MCLQYSSAAPNYKHDPDVSNAHLDPCLPHKPELCVKWAHAAHAFKQCRCNTARGRGVQPAEAAAREPAAWELDFNIWRPASPLYCGTDSELTMKLTAFWFFCNRPTVGALIGFGTDLAAATAVAKPKPGDVQPLAGQSASSEKAASEQPVSILFSNLVSRELLVLLCVAIEQCLQYCAAHKTEELSTAALMSQSCAGPERCKHAHEDCMCLQVTDKGDGENREAAPMRLEGGRTRVVFRLGIELQKLEATFNYESADAAPLASLSVQVNEPSRPCSRLPV